MTEKTIDNISNKRSKKKNIDKPENSSIRETLWNIIHRFDSLIESTNTKAALLIAFNTFIFGGILLKWNEILPSFTAHPFLAIIGLICLASAAIASVLSLLFTIAAINPFLESGGGSKKYCSNIFFKDIAAYEEAGGYYKAIKTASPNSLDEDLVFQIYDLSKGILKKYKFLKNATNTILYLQLPAFAGVVITKFIASIFK